MLVKTLVAVDGKVTFICHKCRTTCTRRADVKHYWKSSCAHNPSPEIQCRHCTVKKFLVRGKSNLVVHLQTVHELVGDFVCLKCQALFGLEALLKKHFDGCRVVK